MTQTPLVKRLLILWFGLWVLSFLTELGGFGISNLLALSPTRLSEGGVLDRLAALPGVVTYAFVHDPFWILHVAINGYLLWLFGGEVEILFPGRRFIRFVAVTALVGAAVHLVLFLLLGGVFRSSVVGGSGVVSAVIAVNAAMYPGRILNLIFLRCRLISFFLVIIGLDLLWFVADLAGKHDGVAHDVHLSGAAVGWLWVGGLRRFESPVSRWLDRRAARTRERARRRQREDEQELDRILAKIGRDGMNSLTPGERRFLQRRSRRDG